MGLDLSLVCPCCKTTVFECGVTHNLGAMAREAGVYQFMWHPEEGATATCLTGHLVLALAAMAVNPERFKKHNPPNGWGDYDGFRKTLGELLDACVEHPQAIVVADR